MFGSIRDKIYSLQENLSATFRSLTVTDPISGKEEENPIPSINLNAGTALLERFQSFWFELHDASQNIATSAMEAGELVDSIHKSAERQWKDMVHLTGVFSSLPDVIHSVNDLCNKTVALKELFDTVEKGLIELEDIIDKRQFQNQQLDHKFQLALYKEKKLATLQSLQNSLEENYIEKVKDWKLKKELSLDKCQEPSKKNHKQNICKEIWKTESGSIANEASSSKGNSLEDIILENEDPSALEEFLVDTKDPNQDCIKE